MNRSAVFVILAGAGCVIACVNHSPQITARTVTVPESARAPTAPPESTVLPCAVTERENSRIYETALATWGDSANQTDGGKPALTKNLPHPCLRAEKSAWAIALDTFKPETYPIYEATWSVVHVDAKGVSVRYRDDDDSIFTAGSGGADYGPTAFSTFDFDDDGEPEIVVRYTFGSVERADEESIAAFRFNDGTIARFIPVAGWNDLRDIDGDGRPDAVVAHQATDSTGCENYESEDVTAPTLVAHSIKGGFSTTDAFAKSSATKACPSRPAKIVMLEDHLVDETATATNVICARAWGASAEEVTRAIRGACRAYSGCLDSQPRLPGECIHLQTLLRWATEAPIVSL